MRTIVYTLTFLFFFSCSHKNSIQIQSPDGNIQATIGINVFNNLFYSVNSGDSVIIQPSSMGFQIENETGLGRNVKIISYSEMEVNQKWKPVFGERFEIQDQYKQCTIHLREKTKPTRYFDITVRLYNEGVAFNTTFLPVAENEILNISKEKTEFNFNRNLYCYASERAQSEIQKIQINEISNPVERPLVIETENHFLALGEARLVDFPRMKFSKGEKDNSLITNLHGEALVHLPYTTPWRTIMIGKTPGELLENNFFYENLNDPCAIKDLSWIKPGKVIREVTLTTQGGLACVDFAAENGLQYVEFDAGWYGPENDETSDASTITVDPKRSPGPLDLHRVIEYGKSKNIGIILYVNRRALEKQLDEIFPLYHSWGIKGVKFGFVQVGSQEWTIWLHEAVKKAADNKLMVDIHDEYRPTGFSRTYPNLLTQEGIRGDEESPTNEHTLKTLFTRMLAGAGDNTNCYFAPRVTEKMGRHVSQLAKAVMIYSPWQFLYWYDRPEGSPGKKGGAGNSDGFIKNYPELEFYRNLPTVWDETLVLEGKIGEFATIARRLGNDWFLGSLTANQKRKCSMNFNFLNDSTKYTAKIYTSDPGSASLTKIKIDEVNLFSNQVLTFEIDSGSGLAMHIQKN